MFNFDFSEKGLGIVSPRLATLCVTHVTFKSHVHMEITWKFGQLIECNMRNVTYEVHVTFLMLHSIN